MTSLLKSRLPALLLALYLFSFWALPQGWNEENLLDGSWRYALGRFRELGFSLGRDSWFTYGPLAHWFGAPMGQERFQPLPYYLLGLFVVTLVALHLTRIFDALNCSFRARLAVALLIPVSFLGMEGSHEVHLVLALFMLLVSCSLRQEADRLALAALVLLGACAMLYKISSGMMFLFPLVLLLLSLLAGRRIGAGAVALHLAGYLALLYLLFVLTSGSWDLPSYLALGLETAGKYSEIMVLNLPFSPPNYLIALLYLAAGAVLAWQAGKKTAGPYARLCLIMALAGGALLLFKHGFVRADSAHMRLFYANVTPVLALLALVSWAGLRAKAKGEKLLLCSACLLLFLIYAVMLKILPGEAGPARLAGNWLGIGSRFSEALHGQDPAEFQAKKAFTRNSQPQLFARLNQTGRAFSAREQGRQPRIAFYPWELMLFEGVEGYQLAPSPSLQLYSTGPHSRAHRLEAEFLSSARRPDFVVLGAGSLDQRSPVAELTDLFPPLWSYYHLVEVVDGFAILEANQAGRASGRALRPADAAQGAPGELLRLSLDQARHPDGVLWRLACILFKAPELEVLVTVTDGRGERVQHLWRGYLSQLRQGVLFAPRTLPELLLSTYAGAAAPAPAQADPAQADPGVVISAAAELRRADGFWNLPVVPRHLPLKVEYLALR